MGGAGATENGTALANRQQAVDGCRGGVLGSAVQEFDGTWERPGRRTPVVLPSIILAYIPPEVVLPVASVLAGVVGFIMMVGRAPIRFVKGVFRRVARSR